MCVGRTGQEYADLLHEGQARSALAGSPERRPCDTADVSLRDSLRSNTATLAVGLLALVLGTLAGWSGSFASAVLSPVPLVRAILAAAAVILGIAWLAQALGRLSTSPAADPDGADSEPAPRPPVPAHPAVLIRAVRLVFLAVAAFAAAFGWLAGQAVPVVLALIVAGVDVVETTFLLLVVVARGSDEAS
jgi:hypothetical protein